MPGKSRISWLEKEDRLRAGERITGSPPAGGLSFYSICSGTPRHGSSSGCPSSAA